MSTQDPILPYMIDATAPAFSCEGRTCEQCGDPAWHAQGVDFCRSHDQRTMRDARLQAQMAAAVRAASATAAELHRLADQACAAADVYTQTARTHQDHDRAEYHRAHAKTSKAQADAYRQAANTAVQVRNLATLVKIEIQQAGALPSRPEPEDPPTRARPASKEHVERFLDSLQASGMDFGD